MKKLTVFFALIIISTQAHAAWFHRCVKYVWDQTGERRSLTMADIDITSTGRLIAWNVPDVARPDLTSSSFPTVNDAGIVRMPADRVIYDAGTWRAKTQAETIHEAEAAEDAKQAGKSDELKATEGEWGSIVDDILDPGHGSVSPQGKFNRKKILDVVDAIENLPEQDQALAFRRLVLNWIRFQVAGGDLDDIHVRKNARE